MPERRFPQTPESRRLVAEIMLASRPPRRDERSRMIPERPPGYFHDDPAIDQLYRMQEMTTRTLDNAWWVALFTALVALAAFLVAVIK